MTYIRKDATLYTSHDTQTGKAQGRAELYVIPDSGVALVIEGCVDEGLRDIIYSEARSKGARSVITFTEEEWRSKLALSVDLGDNN